MTLRNGAIMFDYNAAMKETSLQMFQCSLKKEPRLEPLFRSHSIRLDLCGAVFNNSYIF